MRLATRHCALIFALLVVIPLVYAAVNVDIKWTADVTHYNAKLFHCADFSCSNIIGEKMQDIDSGDSNEIVTSFTAASNANDYHATYFTKQCFVPKGLIIATDGRKNFTREEGLGFNKKFDCSSEIESLLIANKDEIFVNQELFLTAVVRSAFKSSGAASGVPTFRPEELVNGKFYSSDVKIRFEVLPLLDDNVLHSEEKTVSILLDDSEDVIFKWVPIAPGTYRARVTTIVIDCKCASNVEMMQEASFRVVTETTSTTTTTTTTTSTTTVDGSTTTTTIDGISTTTTVLGGGGSRGGGLTSFSIEDVRLDKKQVAAGEKLRVFVDLEKEGGSRIVRNIAVRISIKELGIERQTERFDFEERKATVMIELAVPANAKPGSYLITVEAFTKDKIDIEYERVVVLPAKETTTVLQVSETGLEGITGGAISLADGRESLFGSLMFRMALMAVFALAIVYMIFKL